MKDCKRRDRCWHYLKLQWLEKEYRLLADSIKSFFGVVHRKPNVPGIKRQRHPVLDKLKEGDEDEI